MRERESSLQESGELLLKAQADQALRMYFVSSLKRTDWHRRPASTVVDERGRTTPLAALEQLRMRLRTRHYSYRTECTYADWVRRFLDHAAQQQGVSHPRVESEVVHDCLTHLAVRQRVSANTQNQAFCAILFLCRAVLGLNLDGVSPGVKAKRGERLPVVLSMPETVALLGEMPGTPRLMAALTYGGGLRVSECCELRIKDVDFDQGLVFVRRGKGDKDRSTLLAEVGREELRTHLRNSEAQHQADRRTNEQPSFARVDIRAADPHALDRILEAVRYLGATTEVGDCVFAPAEADGILPDAFYSSTNFDTLVRIDGRWVEVLDHTPGGRWHSPPSCARGGWTRS